jgi:hypothetical protein
MVSQLNRENPSKNLSPLPPHVATAERIAVGMSKNGNKSFHKSYKNTQSLVLRGIFSRPTQGH